jgi:hypothetical protein
VPELRSLRQFNVPKEPASTAPRLALIKDVIMHNDEEADSGFESSESALIIIAKH